MINPAHSSERQRLEHLFQQSGSTHFRLRLRLWQMLQGVGKSLMNGLTHDRQVPRLWTTPDATGNSIWHVYDPATGQSFFSPSENELRS